MPEYLSTNPQTDICRNELENMLSGLPYSKSDLSSQDEISLRVMSEILINEMSGNKPDRRERAREAFMELGLFRTWSGKINDESVEIRIAAVIALGAYGGTNAVMQLRQRLGDRDVSVRRAVVNVLGAIGDRAILDELERFSHIETDPEISGRLIPRAMRKIALRGLESRDARPEKLQPVVNVVTSPAISVAPPVIPPTQPAVVKVLSANSAENLLESHTRRLEDARRAALEKVESLRNRARKIADRENQRVQQVFEQARADESRLKQLQAERDRAEEEAGARWSAEAKLKAEIEELERAEQAEVRRLRDLTEQLKAATAARESAAGEANQRESEYQQKIRELESVRSRIEAESEQQQAEQAEIQRQIDELTNSKAQQEAALDDARAQCEALKRTHERLVTESKQLASEESRRREELLEAKSQFGREAEDRSNQELAINAEIEELRRAEKEQLEALEAACAQRRKHEEEFQLACDAHELEIRESERLKLEVEEQTRLLSEAKLKADEEARRREEEFARQTAELEESKRLAEEAARQQEAKLTELKNSLSESEANATQRATEEQVLQEELERLKAIELAERTNLSNLQAQIYNTLDSIGQIRAESAERMEEQNRLLVEFENAITSAESESQQLQDRVLELQAAVDALRAEESNERQKLADIGAKHADAVASLEQLRSDSEKGSESLALKLAELDECRHLADLRLEEDRATERRAKEELARQTVEVENAREQIAKIESRLESMQDECETARAEAAELEEEEARLLTELESIRQNSLAAAETRSGEQAKLSAEIEQLQELEKVQLAQLEELDTRLAAIRESRAKLATSIEAREQEEREQIAELEARKLAAETEASKRAEEHRAVLEEITSIEVKTEEHREMLLAAQASHGAAVEKHEQTLAEIRERNLEAERQLLELAELRDETEQEIKETAAHTESRLRELEEIRQQAQSDLAAAIERVEKLESEIESAWDAERAQREAAEQAAVRLEAANAQLDETRAEIATRLNELELRKSALEDASKKQIEERQKLDAEIRTFEDAEKAENEELERLVARLEGARVSLAAKELQVAELSRDEKELLNSLIKGKQQVEERLASSSEEHRVINAEIDELTAREAQQIEELSRSAARLADLELRCNSQQAGIDGQNAELIRLEAEITLRESTTAESLQRQLEEAEARVAEADKRLADLNVSINSLEDAANEKASEEAIRFAELQSIKERVENEAWLRAEKLRELNSEIERHNLEATQAEAAVKEAMARLAAARERSQEAKRESVNLSNLADAAERLKSTAPDGFVSSGEGEDSWFIINTDSNRTGKEIEVAHEGSANAGLHGSEPMFKSMEVVRYEKGIEPVVTFTPVPGRIAAGLSSENVSERSDALHQLAEMGSEEAFNLITNSFDDSAPQVRVEAAKALYEWGRDRGGSFTRALREASPERRKRIGSAMVGSGLAKDALESLDGEDRDRTYAAFALLFLMAKIGATQPLVSALERKISSESKLTIIKLLTLAGNPEVIPAFRRLAVRGSLPTEVRSALVEGLNSLSSRASANEVAIA